MVITAGSLAAIETGAPDVGQDRQEEAETADQDPAHAHPPAAPPTTETETGMIADLTIVGTREETWTAAMTETADTAGIVMRAEADVATARHKSAPVATAEEPHLTHPNVNAEAVT